MIPELIPLFVSNTRTYKVCPVNLMESSRNIVVSTIERLLDMFVDIFILELFIFIRTILRSKMSQCSNRIILLYHFVPLIHTFSLVEFITTPFRKLFPNLTCLLTPIPNIIQHPSNTNPLISITGTVIVQHVNQSFHSIDVFKKIQVFSIFPRFLLLFWSSTSIHG